MSPIKQGRPKKNLRISPFSNVLNEIGGEPSKWSLKNDWIAFSKLYFNTFKFVLSTFWQTKQKDIDIQLIAYLFCV